MGAEFTQEGVIFTIDMGAVLAFAIFGAVVLWIVAMLYVAFADHTKPPKPTSDRDWAKAFYWNILLFFLLPFTVFWWHVLKARMYSDTFAWVMMILLVLCCVAYIVLPYRESDEKKDAP